MATSRTKKRRRSLVVRPLEPEDLEQVGEIFRSPKVVAGTLQLPLQSTDELRNRLETVNPNLRALVAEVSGKVVGIASLHLATRPRLRHTAMLGMSVRDDFQGQGVGGALLDAVVELAEKWCAILRIELTVFVDNDAAIRLYRSRGFVIEGIARAFGLRDGKLVDAFRMARVSDQGWPRVTAEEVTSRTPPQLPAGRDPSGNGHGKRRGGDGDGSPFGTN